MPKELLNTRDLGELHLPDTDANLHRVADLWAERPLILVFLRHFG